MIRRRSPEWMRQQLVTIGSSASGVVAGLSQYQSRLELYDAMVAAAEGEVTEKELTDDMRRGLLTEPLHRQLLEDTLGRTVHEHPQDEFMYNAKYPWAHALPDGWLYDISLETPPDVQVIPVQLKCPRIKSWYDIKLRGIHGYWLIGSQHCLAVTGAPYEYFSVLNVEAMRLLHFPVYRDDELIGALMEIEREFHEQFQRRARPPETAPALTAPALNGKLLTLDTREAHDVAEAYIASRTVRDEAAQLMEEAELRMRKLMGDARVVQLPKLVYYRIPVKGRETPTYRAYIKEK